MALTLLPVDRTEAAFDRIATWRKSHFQVRSQREADLREWYGFTPAQARIVAELYRAQRPMPVEALAAAADVSAKTLRLSLGGIREGLGPGCLPRVDREGSGYQLTQAGRRECERASEEAGLERLQSDLRGIAE